jgi:hypothetical protein
MDNSTMEEAMTALESLMLTVAPLGVPNRRTGLVPAVAMVVGIAAAVGLMACSSGSVDGAMETSAPPPTRMDKTAKQQPLVDHSSVNWDKMPIESDPSPLSVAAYGNSP